MKSGEAIGLDVRTVQTEQIQTFWTGHQTDQTPNERYAVSHVL